jgi:hypothetical protein
MCSLNRMPAPGPGQDGRKRGLADLKRVTAQVVAVEFDKIEGIQKHAGVVPAVANAVKRRHAVVIARDRLSIDDARARAQAGHRLDDQWEAPRQVIAGAAVELDALTVLAGSSKESRLP